MEEPANDSLFVYTVENTMKRSFKPLIGDIDNPEDVKNHFIGIIILTFLLIILGIIFPKLK